MKLRKTHKHTTSDGKYIANGSASDKPSKLFFGVMIFGALLSVANAATRFVRASADVSYNGDGSSWSAATSNGGPGAYKGFPSTLVRGDTYYFAGGNYGKFIFNTPNSGTTTVTVKKATTDDHGTSSGWSDTYGSAQAVFSCVSINKDNFIFDGSTGGGPGSWKTGFGVKIDTSKQTSSSAYPGLFLGELTQSTTSNIVAKHFEVVGDGGDGTANNGGQTNDGVASWGSKNTTISYSYIHDMGRCICIFLPSDGVVWEYNYSGAYEYTAAEHSEIASTNGNNYTFRYNIFAHVEGTGGLMFNGSNQKIYGNVFFHSTSDKTWDYAANGMIGSKGSNEPVKTVLFYNNTIYRGYSDSTGGGPQIFGFYMGKDSIAKNNLIYGQLPSSTGFDLVTHDYNAFVATSGASLPSELNDILSSLTTMLSGAESLDFTPSTNTAAGENLGAPYNVDMYGNTRTTWTRGAIEFKGSAPAVVAPSNAKTQISVQ